MLNEMKPFVPDYLLMSLRANHSAAEGDQHGPNVCLLPLDVHTRRPRCAPPRTCFCTVLRARPCSFLSLARSAAAVLVGTCLCGSALSPQWQLRAWLLHHPQDTQGQDAYACMPLHTSCTALHCYTLSYTALHYSTELHWSTLLYTGLCW